MELDEICNQEELLKYPMIKSILFNTRKFMQLKVERFDKILRDPADNYLPDMESPIYTGPYDGCSYKDIKGHINNRCKCIREIRSMLNESTLCKEYSNLESYLLYILEYYIKELPNLNERLRIMRDMDLLKWDCYKYGWFSIITKHKNPYTM